MEMLSLLCTAEGCDESELRFDPHSRASSIHESLVRTMGCDSLFEHGLIVISDNGTVQAGIATENAALGSAVPSPIDQACSAYD